MPHVIRLFDHLASFTTASSIISQWTVSMSLFPVSSRHISFPHARSSITRLTSTMTSPKSQALSSVSDHATAHTPSQNPLSAPLRLRNSPHKTPTLVYGTAWKKQSTSELVYQAIKSGFRAIDTAAQPRHYQEDLVGSGIRRAIQEGLVKREDLFVSSCLS